MGGHGHGQHILLFWDRIEGAAANQQVLDFMCEQELAMACIPELRGNYEACSFWEQREQSPPAKGGFGALCLFVQ
jgi:hypothetical protein